MANYTTHESFEAEMLDHEDHTFCGIMFDLSCESQLPVDYIEISEIWVVEDLDLSQCG